MRRWRAVAGGLTLLVPLWAHAQPLQVAEAFTLPARARQSAALVLQLANPTSQSVVIQGASSPYSPQVVLRQHTKVEGQNRIESGGIITLAPYSRSKLLPGATEIVLLNLLQPLQAGTEIPLTLRLGAGQTQTLRVEVRDEHHAD